MHLVSDVYSCQKSVYCCIRSRTITRFDADILIIYYRVYLDVSPDSGQILLSGLS